MLLLLLLPISLFAPTVMSTGYNNFKFINTNTVYGHHLNQPIHIHGMYTNNMTIHFNSSQIAKINLSDNMMIIAALGDYIQRCTANTDELLITLGHSSTANNIKYNVAALTNSSATKDKYKPLVNFGDLKYGCKPIFSSGSTSAEFAETITFASYHPVLYIDPFGYSSFNYKLTKTTDKNDEQGTPIRYCQGNNFNGIIYTLGEKPKCPDPKQNQKSAEHKVGLITMYKPNVVTVRHPVNMCTKTKTHVYSGKRAFGSTYNNKPLVGVHEAPTEEDCWNWIKNKRAFCCGKLRKTGGTVGQIYSSNNDKNFRYPWCGSYTNDVYDGFLTMSSLDVEMPSLRIRTPFWDVPTSYLYKKTHSPDNRGRLVWKPFVHPEICLYVPFASAKAKSVKFNHDSKATAHGFKSDSKYVKYFISDALSLVESVDSTERIENPKFNCIPFNEDKDVLYTTKSGYVIKFTEVVDESLLDEDEVVEHPHSSFSKMRISPDLKVISAKPTNYHPAQLHTSSSKPPPAAAQPVINSKDVHVRKPTTDNSVDLLMAAISGSATKTEVLAYNQYTKTQLDNANLRKLAIDSCHRRQSEYELFSLTVSINPTRAIVLKTKTAIEAVHSGPGFFSVRECDYIENIRVIPSLKTNSTMKIKINNQMVPFANISRELGVVPANEKCFSGLLVIFTLSDTFGINNDELFGQINEEGIINTQKAPLLEECTSKMSGENVKIFHIHNLDHVFINYAHAYTLNHNQLSEAAVDVAVRAQETIGNKSVSLGPQPFKKLNEIKQNIRFIWSNDDSIKLQSYSYTPVGLKGNDLYSVPERQSLALGLGDLISAKSEQDLASKRYDAQTIKDYTGNSSGGFDDGFISDIANGLATVIDAGANGITKIVGGGADAVSKLVNTAVNGTGALADDGSSFLSSVGSFLTGTIGELVFPIIAVIVTVIVVYFLYKKWLKGDFDDDEEEDDDDTEDEK